MYRIAGRILAIVFIFVAGFVLGRADRSIARWEQTIETNKARVEAAHVYKAVLETRVGWEELAENQRKCLVGQGWMQDHQPVLSSVAASP